VAVPVGVVVAVVVALVLVKVAGGGSSTPTAEPDRQPAPAGVVTAVTSVPASVLDTIGAPSGLTPPQRLPKATVLTKDGKPAVVYLGAEFCPYCAAERWPMVVALSRFGTFSGLKITHSSSTDVFANTRTLSFVGSSYSSPYITFDPVEFENNRNGPLEQPDAIQTRVEANFDKPPYSGIDGGIPFIDFGNQWSIGGPSYNVQILQGLSWEEIASQLSDPNQVLAVGVDGTANIISAAICQLTGGQPAAVCGSPGVRVATGRIPGAK